MICKLDDSKTADEFNYLLAVHSLAISVWTVPNTTQ